MNGYFKPARALSLLAAAAMVAMALPAIAGTLNVSQTTGAAANQAHALAGEFALTVSNDGAGDLAEVRVVSDRDHLVDCGMQTVQGRGFATQTLAAGDSLRCIAYPLAQTRLRNASIVVLARDADGKRVQRTFNLMQPAATPAQGIAVLAGGGIHNDANIDGLLQAGETISYDYTVLNLGTLALSSLVVTDIDGAVTCPTTLAVGASMTCSSTHTITVAEAGAGMVFNQVDLNGVDASSTPIIAGDFIVTQNLGGDAGIRVFKSPLLFDDVDNSLYASPGDVLRYTFVIKNDNAQTLASVNLVEPDPSRIDTPITCNPTTRNGQPFGALGSATLQSNDVVLCRADYTVKPADATNGSADNLVNASAQPGIGGPVQGTGASAVVIPTPASLTMTKALTGESGSQPGIVEPGETLTYTITLNNSGAANAFNAGVVDPLDPNVSFVSASNGGTPSGATVVWSGLSVPGNGNLVLTVVVTVANPLPLSATRILNMAYVGGTTPPNCNALPLPANCTNTPTLAPPRLQVTKTVNAPSIDPGGVATYTVTVTNVGTVVANNVVISDPLPAGIVAFQWTCAGSSGATCANASGSGAINETIPSLPIGGVLTYTVSATFAANAAGTVLNSVLVTPSQNTVCMPQQQPGPCDATVPVIVRGTAPTKVPTLGNLAMLLMGLAMVALAWQRRERQSR